MDIKPDTDVGAHVSFENVNVEFPIYSSHGRSLKRSMLQFTTAGRVGLSSDDRLVVRALKSLSFEAKHGDRIGLIGRNGSGKSTLLRALAGVYEPVSGLVRIRGRVQSLIDINLGLDIEASGYENIRVRCLLRGVGKKQLERRMEDIAEVTELGEFLHMPVRTYSSGMVLRLGFAISTSMVPDILLMDEWIGVGDSTFVEKAQKRLREMVGASGILFIASHNAEIIEKTCNRVLWLDQGDIRMDGCPNEVLKAYGDCAS
ncbi:ABC transporter ATP-binding protein [Pontivivens ytuae]|uniref:ABC transporter ATP-binding protein n=2 Tax=Pontivivens ytuae TaxID=2789856 RepID=A0A7S9LWR8_9RHOB|nr:ABC transporter ATP-binding protein [Pontivivens ytuae]